MTEKHTCCAKSYPNGSYQGVTCGKTAAHEHEGKWYCKTHHPPTVKARRDARDEARKAQWKRQNDAARISRSVHAEMVRRAGCYEELLALLIESQEDIGGDWRARRDAAILKATGEQA